MTSQKRKKMRKTGEAGREKMKTMMTMMVTMVLANTYLSLLNADTVRTDTVLSGYLH